MLEPIIGRETELRLLHEYLNSDRSEFIAVYGRRRVGKTFLIRQSTQDHFAFYVTGANLSTKQEQLTNFCLALQNYNHSPLGTTPRNWLLMFHQLGLYLESLPAGNKTVFLDELPWMDTAKSGFLGALEVFWNGWAALRSDIKLIVCGSATSWMLNNLIHNRGGLHNRLTHSILLEPFTLQECEAYFHSHGFGYRRHEIAEAYMILGGVPFYLSLLKPNLSLTQNIDQLFFASTGELRDEYINLYQAIFKKSTPYLKIIAALATKGIGLTRQRLLEQTKLTDNGTFSQMLDELEQCGFIRSYLPLMTAKTTERHQKDTLYQLIDFYTLFFFTFAQNNHYHDEHFWSNTVNSPLHNTWCGLAFEKLCMTHFRQLKKALGISGIQARVCSWFAPGSAQIDLVFDRADNTINLFEIKYYKDVFTFTRKIEDDLLHKIAVFIERTGTRKSVMMTLITTAGATPSSAVQTQLTLDDLFC